MVRGAQECGTEKESRPSPRARAAGARGDGATSSAGVARQAGEIRTAPTDRNEGKGWRRETGDVNTQQICPLFNTQQFCPNGQISCVYTPAIARRLKLRRGPEVEIRTASDVIPGYLVTLDDVSIGPLSLKRARGSVSERSIDEEVLLGMSFLRHFELSQRGRNLTVRAPPI